MKARAIRPGHGIRAHGRAWRVTLVQAQPDGDLRVYLDADDGELLRMYDQADLYVHPDQDIEVYM
ncbi:hypothetical protein [Nocardiopsis synnemataformans]|uniref:hypothetical protein n=1 Tax=Nocardiopsis synnemataformans TaxID=61305 RepID=UPI003EBA300B